MNNSTPIHRSTILLLTVCVSILLLFTDGFWADMDCFRRWADHLALYGYDGFTGNYPPIYVHWLWLVGKLYALTGTPIEVSFFFKLFIILPGIVAHLGLLRLVWWYSDRYSLNTSAKNILLIVTAVNPAFLLNGPIWAQVDLLPMVLIVGALICSVEKIHLKWVPTLFFAALLTKFQMILFLPLFGALFFKEIKSYSIGLLYTIPVVGLLLLPYLVTSSLDQMINHAFLGNTSLFPYVTLNAANFWMLFKGNIVLDSVEVLPGLSAKHFGMLTFTLFSLGVFVKTLLSKSKVELLVMASFLPFAFFTTLTQMHERYLFAAVPVLLVWSIHNRKVIPLYIVATVVTFLNILLVLPVSGDKFWPMLSLVSVLLFVVLAVAVFIPSLNEKALQLYRKGIARFDLVPEALLLIVFIMLAAVGYKVTMNRVAHHDLPENGIYLSELPVSYTGPIDSLKVNHHAKRGTLRMDGKIHLYGLGTIASGRAVVQIPQGTTRFTAKVGFDDSSNEPKGIIRVYGDTTQLWQSELLSGAGAHQELSISVDGYDSLILVTENMSCDTCAMVDWAYPVFE
ncbi:MAG: NPCBM/NEW2 domain-containing protein [Fibrobacterales bacterium]